MYSFARGCVYVQSVMNFSIELKDLYLPFVVGRVKFSSKMNYCCTRRTARRGRCRTDGEVAVQ